MIQDMINKLIGRQDIPSWAPELEDLWECDCWDDICLMASLHDGWVVNSGIDAAYHKNGASIYYRAGFIYAYGRHGGELAWHKRLVSPRYK